MQHSPSLAITVVNVRPRFQGILREVEMVSAQDFLQQTVSAKVVDDEREKIHSTQLHCLQHKIFRQIVSDSTQLSPQCIGELYAQQSSEPAGHQLNRNSKHVQARKRHALFDDPRTLWGAKGCVVMVLWTKKYPILHATVSKEVVRLQLLPAFLPILLVHVLACRSVRHMKHETGT